MGSSKGHIPERTCISCGVKRYKKGLIRLVLDGQRLVVRDEGGKAPGRGAYICKGGACLMGLVSSQRLQKAFRVNEPVHLHPDLLAE
jgi:predicted RNA-binding protein YlxR (DUF448 family)